VRLEHRVRPGSSGGATAPPRDRRPGRTEYRDWLARQGVDVSAVAIHEDVFTASFFVSTDRDQNQLASFYTEPWRGPATSPARAVSADAALVVISPNDPDAMARYARECRELASVSLRPQPAGGSAHGRGFVAGLEGAFVLIVNDYEFNILSQKTGLSREGPGGAGPGARGHARRGGFDDLGGWPARAGAPPDPRRTAREGGARPDGVGDAYRAGLVRGIRIGATWDVAGRIGSVAAAIVLRSEAPAAPIFGR
jgi:adenosine kinase